MKVIKLLLYRISKQCMAKKDGGPCVVQVTGHVMLKSKKYVQGSNRSHTGPLHFIPRDGHEVLF